MFMAALWLLHRLLGGHHLADVRLEIRLIATNRTAAAVGLTMLSYLTLTFYDQLATIYLQHRLPKRKITLVSFISYAFSNNIGLSLFTSGTIRYRFYTAWGFSSEEISRLIVFTTGTFWLGILTVGGFLFVLEPPALTNLLPWLSFKSARPLGLLFGGAVLAYLVAAIRRPRPLQIRGWQFPLPQVKIAAAQLVIGSLDWLLAGSVLYVLLPPGSGLSYWYLLSIYLFAQTLALASNIPGGLGVFESLVLLAAPTVSPAALMGALLVYRGIYYLVPFMMAVLLLGFQELEQGRARLISSTRVAANWISPLVPPLLAVATLMAGAVLLFSGATPAVPVRLVRLRHFIPLSLLELSHFLASIIGAAFLLLARGLQRRLDGAWLSTIILLAVGIFVSLVKGLDYEEAVLLGLLLVILLTCRRQFYRHSSLFNEPLTMGWLVSIIMVLAAAIWLGFFSYQHIAYSDSLWWQFAFHAEAPRFLRALVGTVTLLLLYAIARLLAPGSKVSINMPGTEELSAAAVVVRSSPCSEANLALLGDKRLLFDHSGTGFIMYGIKGRSWIAMGDPVGAEPAAAELVWSFRELAERHGGWPVFYEVGSGTLHRYLDLGLTLFKIGEEAKVPLAEFSLEGSHRSELRYIQRRLQKEGYSFAVIDSSEVDALLPELGRISDNWLQSKHTREKGFSLGFFDPAYLKRFSAALVRRDEKIVAFANLWETAGKEELSVDLMRYEPQEARGIMDFLFVNLMLWGREQGFGSFVLGMAPLAGLENRPFAPLWNRLGAMMYRHGEHFYNFEGLRAYKNKFLPVWEPRYLACPGGLSLPMVLVHLTTLISGGLKGSISK
ncbi:MAG: bifunctional lysylphosphatidylglycerol flippase/synthetase MprF [Deltaproteobacteria bacterium]|nr:bifunctional lysylphosphatidylglycerol flippase/synthetase MprF [Candidatus Anaeroferrophillus wilburensis]MBN2888010.1 bifunctional lysylphosphatidylglycerol flippase/synthetase MprF [Deltaproteobacteria bacterium]